MCLEWRMVNVTIGSAQEVMTIQRYWNALVWVQTGAGSLLEDTISKT